MHFLSSWLGPASSLASVIALVVTLLYYFYCWPFNLKKPQGLTAKAAPDRVSLTWRPVHRAGGYNVYRTHAASGAVDVFPCPTHFYADTDPLMAGVHEYSVIAVDQGHLSPPSDTASVTIQDVSPSIVESEWSLEDLRRLRPLIQNNKTVLALLGLAASQPDTLVSFADVCERAGVTRPQGGGSLGAFTQTIRRLGKSKWPFTFHPGQGGPFYKLSSETAERWRQAEAGAQGGRPV